MPVSGPDLAAFNHREQHPQGQAGEHESRAYATGEAQRDNESLYHLYC